MTGRMTFRVLLPIFLVAVSCKTTRIADRQQASPPSQSASQPESMETHRSIASAMFPNAKENIRNANCFRAVTPGMSVQAVVQKCGRPDEEVGTDAIFTFVWHMPNGSSVAISTPTLEKIGEVMYDKQPGAGTPPVRKQ